jgi:hypothetical protein
MRRILDDAPETSFIGLNGSPRAPARACTAAVLRAQCALMGPKPGQIRCPTCHRSTLPAAYCTHCGSPIPESARAQPRGLNRDELQERIRARRSGPMPFRRGSAGDEGYEAPPFAERYEPEPEDERIRRRRAAAAAGGVAGADAMRRVDNTAPGFDAEAEAARRRAEEEAAAAAAQRDAESAWARPAESEPGPFRRGQAVDEPQQAAPAAPVSGAYEQPADQRAGEIPWPDESRATAPPVDARPPAVAAQPTAAQPEPEVVDRFDDDAYETPDPRYYYETEERNNGIGIGAVLGIAALGVLALFVGIMLAGVFGGDDGVGQEVASPSQSTAATDEASAAPTASLAPSATATPAASASPSGGEFTFPDGFTAEAQPCANPPNSADCGSSGARNNGNVWIVVSFRNGTASDVVSATVEQADGTQVPGGGSIALADINCGDSCNGYTYFQFQNLEDGTYTVHVTRNGEAAGETGFTVER